MKLGKIQKAWVDSLKKHPERQTTLILGKGNLRNYKACCLGEALIVLCRIKKKRIPFKKDGLLCSGKHEDALVGNYEKIGLRSSLGGLLKPVVQKSKNWVNLSEMNDNGWTWPQIADYIEKNPENVFKRSV